jgi:transposase
MSPIVAEQYAFVIGVDTHAAPHAFALVAGPTGAVLDRGEFSTSAAGLIRALNWLDQRVQDLAGSRGHGCVDIGQLFLES